jgi:hypothetical protein
MMPLSSRPSGGEPPPRENCVTAMVETVCGLWEYLEASKHFSARTRARHLGQHAPQEGLRFLMMKERGTPWDIRRCSMRRPRRGSASSSTSGPQGTSRNLMHVRFRTPTRQPYGQPIAYWTSDEEPIEVQWRNAQDSRSRDRALEIPAEYIRRPSSQR